MITAAEFIDLDFSDSEAEKQRLERLISSLPDYPQTIRTGLAEEFLKIIGDPNETFGRRVQAASMLAYQPKRLGIRGSTPVAQAVCGVLEKEFVRLTVKHSCQPAQETDARIKCYELFCHHKFCIIGVVKTRELGPVPS